MDDFTASATVHLGRQNRLVLTGFVKGANVSLSVAKTTFFDAVSFPKRITLQFCGCCSVNLKYISHYLKPHTIANQAHTFLNETGCKMLKSMKKTNKIKLTHH